MIAHRIKQLRKQNNWTQEELARRLHTKKTTISNYETGYSTPSNEMLRALADEFDVSTDYLLGRVDHPKPMPEAGDELDDPEVGIFFKDFQQAPKERREEMLRFWRFIRDQERSDS